MTPTLEDRVRDALAYQAERTAIDPHAEFDAHRAASAWAAPGGTDRLRGRSVRPLAVAAAVAALLGGLVLARQRMPGQSLGDAALSPVSIVADPPSVDGLPFEVGVAELPPGWDYADVAETTNIDDELGQDWSSFLFRNSTGGVILIQARPQTDPTAEYGDPDEGLATDGNATFAVDGNEIWMMSFGVAADVATEIAHSLTPTTNGVGDVSVTLESDTGFDLDEQRLASTHTATDGAIGMILLSTPNGLALLVLDSRDPTNDAVNHFGTPSQVDGSTVYSSDQSVTGDPIDGQIAATVLVGEPADLDAAQRLRAALRRVDGNTDVVGWDEVQDRVAAKLSALEVTDTTDVGDLVVTRHRGDSPGDESLGDNALEAVCASWHDVTRCRSSISPSWIDDFDTGARVDLVVDGLWVVAGWVNADGPIDAPTAAPDPEDAIGVWEPNETGASYVYAVPSATKINISVADGPDGQVGFSSMSFDRPIR